MSWRGTSTPSPHKADNMPLKSGLSIGGSREGPGVEGELPHHGQPLGRGGGGEIAIGCVVREWEDADGPGLVRHSGTDAPPRLQALSGWGRLIWELVRPTVFC